MKKILFLLFSALFVGTGSMMADADLTISNVTEWKAFCSNVNNGTETYSGKTVVLDADIVMEASGYQAQSVGNSAANSFQGTFDGQGHTITYNFPSITGLNHIAPFRYIKSATIKNVKVAGSLTVTDNNLLGGIVGYVGGASTSDISYIDNCMSSITLTNSASSGDGRIGGIVAYQLATSGLQITNCLVEGTINGRGQAAGVMGYKKNGASLSVSNILLTSEITGKVNTFVKSEGGEQTISSCYTTIASPDQGTYVTTANLESGEVAYNLQGSQVTQYWGQAKLNTSIASAVPELTSVDSKKVIKISCTNGPLYANKGGAMPSPVGVKALSLRQWNGSAWLNGPFDEDVSLQRVYNKYILNVSSAGATTLVLPGNVSSLPTNVKAYELTYTSGDKATASEVTSITANKPVLINAPAGQYVLTTDNDESEITYDTETAYNNGALYGVYTDTYKYVPKDSYVLQYQDDELGFYRVEEANTVKITSFRAYLTPQGSLARSIKIVYMDDVTGVENVNSAEVTVQKNGKYFENGKIVIFKNGMKFNAAGAQIK